MVKSLPSTLLGVFCIAAAMNQAFGLTCYHCTENGNGAANTEDQLCTPSTGGFVWTQTTTCSSENTKAACKRWVLSGGKFKYGCDKDDKDRDARGCRDEGMLFVCYKDTGPPWRPCNTKEDAETSSCTRELWLAEKAKKDKEEAAAAAAKKEADKKAAAAGLNGGNGDNKNDTDRNGAADKSLSWNFLASIVFLLLTITGFLQIGGGVII